MAEQQTPPTPATQATSTSPTGDAHRLRSGTAARLAGLPVTTLRVWERRYGVVAAQKSASGQRLYAPHDVARLRLLRQLTHLGHAIGTMAHLDLPTLQALGAAESPLAAAAGAILKAPAPGAAPQAPDAVARAASAAPQAPGAHPTAQRVLNAVVVGRHAAQTLAAVSGCAVRTVHDDIDHALAAPPAGGPIDLLLVRVASLQPAGVEQILALTTALRAGSVFVAYAFGTEASVLALREAGATAQREPLAEHDLARWVRDARETRVPAPTATPAAAPWPIAPRRFDDVALARLAGMPSPVACECLRHLTDIVAQLGSFEQYSQDCVSTGPADAALHHHLARTAGTARTLFEQALQRVLDEAGLVPVEGSVS